MITFTLINFKGALGDDFTWIFFSLFFFYKCFIYMMIGKYICPAIFEEQYC